MKKIMIFIAIFGFLFAGLQTKEQTKSTSVNFLQGRSNNEYIEFEQNCFDKIAKSQKLSLGETRLLQLVNIRKKYLNFADKLRFTVGNDTGKVFLIDFKNSTPEVPISLFEVNFCGKELVRLDKYTNTEWQEIKDRLMFTIDNLDMNKEFIKEKSGQSLSPK